MSLGRESCIEIAFAFSPWRVQSFIRCTTGLVSAGFKPPLISCPPSHIGSAHRFGERTIHLDCVSRTNPIER